MSFIAPEADVRAARTGVTAFGDPVLGGSPLSPARSASISSAVIAGFQSSATGLALRGKLPSQQLGEDAPWYERAAAGAAGVVADLPLSIVGAVGGGVAGSAVAPGPGTVIGAGAGGFAAPMALRDALIEAYSNNHALSWEGVWEITKAALKGGTKGAVIGGATMGAGRVVGPLVAKAGGGPATQGAAAFSAELGTMTTTAAALEGHMPTAQDFMDGAILLGGLKGAVHTAKGLMNIYAETGRKPEQVLADAQANPAIKAALAGETLSPKKVVEVLVGKQDPNADTLPQRAYAATLKDGSDATVTFAERAGDSVQFRISNAEGEQMGGGAFFPVEGKPGRWEGHYHIEEQFRRQGAMTAAMNVFERETGQRLQPSATASPDALALWKTRRAQEATDIPPQYTTLAIEQRIKAALDFDPRPEIVRKNLNVGREGAPKLGEPPIADPVKYEYITDKDTHKGVLRGITDLYQTEMTAQTRGEVSNKATAVEGLKLVSDGVVGRHLTGDAANAAEIYARAHLLKGATNHAVRELEKIARTPEAELTPAAKLEALAAIERVSMLKAEIEGVGAEAGRALQIFRALKRDPALLGEAENLLHLAERKGSLQDIAKMALALKDPAQMAELARKYTEATTIEKWLEGWKAAILSGPQTHLANIFGNTTKWLVEVPETTIAASLLALNKAVQGNPLTMAQWKARAFSPIYGLQHGSREALHVAAEVWRGHGEHLEKADVYRVAIEGKKGEYIRLPFKALQVEDAMFRTIAERAKAYEMAVDRAVREGLHPETAEGRQAVVQWTARPEYGLSEKAGLEAIAKVQEAGAEAVFAQRLGPKMEIAQRAMAGSALGFVIPFVRTPANLVSWALQHTPGLNFMSGRWRADYAAGGERQARAMARFVMGTGLALTAYTMAQDGLLTGGGLFDKEQRATKTAAGWQPYSIKIGDTYYSYQRIEPVAKVLGMAADLVEMLGSKKLDEGDSLKAASMLALLFGNATVSTTYLSGLSNVINGVTDPDRYGEAILEQYASSLVPKIIGQPAAMIDGEKREVDGVIDAIQAQIPFLREKLLPKRDVWGEPTKGARLFAVMPVTMTKESQEKVRTEAVRLQVAIADAPRYVVEKGPFNPRDKRVELTPEQRDVFKAVSGQWAMTILSPIVNAPDWERIPDFAKAEIIRNTITQARRVGRHEAIPPNDPALIQKRKELINKIHEQRDAVGDGSQQTERRVR